MQLASNMQLLSKIKELILAIFSEHTSCVMNKGECISCCKLELAVLHHEKHLTYAVSAEYLSNYKSNKFFIKIVEFWCNIAS